MRDLSYDITLMSFTSPVVSDIEIILGWPVLGRANCSGLYKNSKPHEIAVMESLNDKISVSLRRRILCFIRAEKAHAHIPGSLTRQNYATPAVTYSLENHSSKKVSPLVVYLWAIESFLPDDRRLFPLLCGLRLWLCLLCGNCRLLLSGRAFLQLPQSKFKRHSFFVILLFCMVFSCKILASFKL